MAQNEMKKAVAQSPCEYLESILDRDTIIGVGTGSTTNFFIQELSRISDKIEGTVASSLESDKRLKSFGIAVYDLNSVGEVQVYIDGADESK